MAGPTFGFGTIAADRGVSVETAPDSEAYLGLEDRSSSAAIDSPTETTVVYTLTDGLGGLEQDDIDASVVGLSGDGDATASSLEATVQQGSETGTFDVELACTDAGTVDGAYQVELEFVASATSSSVDATRTTAAFVPVTCGTDDPLEISTDEDGDVTTGGDVTVDNNVAVDGTISSGGSVTVDNNANVGEIVSQGDITVSNNLVSGDIVAGGDVTIGNNAEIDGDVTACGSVEIGNNADVSGTVSDEQTDVDGVQC
ncbi:polymer-forming cytoskeletal protein [Natronolimnohabitans sp. A-GB9]|uniref:polymer-forming cytoskeletal protein n=1 Tax=Natronolimnohabitans sp. A-GB9 TaxID=3069757 RepID=UPI0027B103AC|nr:polymer-forming cytoskeletal protein [Natronolimnohabitans sp. A-GB9]MDQ2051128.1 polymer-forming cytoskeletal protein [Natronolimnohabitans sp. A-GB9]